MINETGQGISDFAIPRGDCWALKQGGSQYLAWKYWLRKEFGVKAFGKGITAPTEWPPSSQLGADRYAIWLSDIRDQVDAEAGCKHMGKPVHRHPEPWDGVVPTKEQDKEMDKPKWSRPIMWWAQDRRMWNPDWRESEAPEGALVRDVETGKWRLARRFDNPEGPRP